MQKLFICVRIPPHNPFLTLDVPSLNYLGHKLVFTSSTSIWEIPRVKAPSSEWPLQCYVIGVSPSSTQVHDSMVSMAEVDDDSGLNSVFDIDYLSDNDYDSQSEHEDPISDLECTFVEFGKVIRGKYKDTYLNLLGTYQNKKSYSCMICCICTKKNN